MAEGGPTPSASPGGPDPRAAELEAAVAELEDVFARLVQVHRRTLTRQAEQLSPGMSLGTIKAFMAVCSHGPLTPSALAEHMLQDRAQVSRTVRDLEEHGLVRREPDPQDRRSALLSATDEGRARLRAVRGGPEGSGLRRALAAWDPEDVRRLAGLLGRFVDGREDEAGTAR